MPNTKGSFTPKLILFIFVYLVLIISMATINVLEVNINIKGSVLTVSDISMIITMIITVWIIINLIIDRESVYKSCLTLYFVHSAVIITGTVITRNIAILPAMLSVVFMYIISTVVYKHLCLIAKKEMELNKIAYTDPLTNMPNKSAFNKLIASLTSNDIEVEKSPFAIVLIDINEFTHINDTAGHDYGDKVLQEVVTRWKFAMKSNDFIARLGGDKFALVIQDYLNEKDLIEHINSFSNVLKNKITVDDQSVFVTASFGISVFPEDSTNPDELMRYADIAMQTVHSSEGQHVALFAPEMIKKVEYDMSIEALIRDALENDRFNLVFQPQYDTSTKKLRGFETLLRLSDTNGKPVSPGIFIPLAEKKGLIIDIDCYVLNKAMSMFKPMLKYKEDILLSINISAMHLAKNSFLNDVSAALKNSGFPAKNLELEITESVFIASLDTTADKLTRVKDMGIQIALDDFGTGYASLSYLTKLPIDLLKIDKAFVDDLQSEDGLTDFVAAIISMGHLLHFNVISEGVEYETQLDKLRMLKCDYIQGFLWGRPIDINSVDKLLQSIA